MKSIALTAAFSILASGAWAQTVASNGFRVCPPEQTADGLKVVEDTCGSIQRPDFTGSKFSSLSDLQAAMAQRDAFRAKAQSYSECVNLFVESYRRPGAPADSTAPDQAACAHAWAQDLATASVREFGRACIAFADRSIIDKDIEPYEGACYLSANTQTGIG